MYIYESPIGSILIEEANNAITKIQLVKKVINSICYSSSLEKKTAKQLREYFEGKRKEYDIPLSLKGTEFQKNVWEALNQIPYGQTRSYKEIAATIGNERASRAIGMANNKNPCLIVIPCHRVIGSNKALVGYALGLDIKEKLLNLEKLGILN